MDLNGRRVLVVGLARTGVSVSRFLLEQGARVVGADVKAGEDLGAAVRELAQQGCLLRLGAHGQRDFLDAELIVVSPGVPLTLAPLEEARRAGIPVIGDVELVFRHLPCPVVGITGTNGKTTTVSLVHAMLRKAGVPHWFGGNIGQPLADFLIRDSAVRGSEAPRLVLMELSSFQLEGIARFRPWIAAWTNLSEDHLDRYPDMQAYAEAKARIFENQTAGDFAIVPARDQWLDAIRGRLKARLLRFGLEAAPQAEVRMEAGRIRFRLNGASEESYPTERVRLPGRHNLENLMVALAAARLCGVSPAAVQEVMEEFQGLEHRLEFVGAREEVRFYNDSKGTTVSSVERALEAFSDPVLLIAGGKDKGGSYASLREPLRQHVRRLFLIGQAAARMQGELNGACEVVRPADLRSAVREAWEDARPGEIVLLSPACSSFDMFRDYEDRGRQFKRWVQEIVEE